VTDEGTVQPWHRVRGEGGTLVEPNLWFDRFEDFRLAGPTRSVLAVYNAWRKGAGKGVAGSVPNSWDRAARRWSWRERAEAWDEHLREERRVKEAEERREAREGRKGIIRGMKAKLAREVLAMSKNEDSLTFDQAVKLAGFVLEEERRELDELPTHRVDVTSAGDRVKVLGLDLDEL
jgi:hypothetical protein